MLFIHLIDDYIYINLTIFFFLLVIDVDSFLVALLNNRKKRLEFYIHFFFLFFFMLAFLIVMLKNELIQSPGLNTDLYPINTSVEMNYATAVHVSRSK